MADRIDWAATMEEWEASAWAATERLPMLLLADPRGLCTEWRNLALQTREENADLKARLAWTGDRLRERIKELEAELERLVVENKELRFVRSKREEELKSELERIKGRPEKWPFK